MSKRQETSLKPDMSKVLSRIKLVIDKRIDSIKEEYKEQGKVLKKEDILAGYSTDGPLKPEEKLPISRDTYYKYNREANGGTISKGFTLQIDTLYAICKSTGVSADYLLGFIETSRKEQSAEMVRQEFGLSDESMKFLKEAHERSPASRGEVTSSLVNIILGDSRFWYEMNLILPIYISSKNHEYRTDDRLEFMTKYSLIQNFDALLNAIDKGINEQDKTPVAELDETDPYFMTI